MKKLLILSMLLIAPAFAQEAEPNFYDISDTYASIQRMRAMCQTDNPECADVCTQGVNYSLDQLKTGGNVNPEVASALNQYWTACQNLL